MFCPELSTRRHSTSVEKRDTSALPAETPLEDEEGGEPEEEVHAQKDEEAKVEANVFDSETAEDFLGVAEEAELAIFALQLGAPMAVQRFEDTLEAVVQVGSVHDPAKRNVDVRLLHKEPGEEEGRRCSREHQEHRCLQGKTGGCALTSSWKVLSSRIYPVW